MSIDSLMESLRGAAGEEELRRVLADALLEAGDPRGELMIKQLDGRRPGRRIDAALAERCLSTVRAAVPGLRRARLEAGLVTEVELELNDVPRIDPAWLAGEPLACVTTDLPGEEKDIAPALDAATATLGACRGFALSSRLLAPRTPRVLELITETDPAVLGLDLGPELDLSAFDLPVYTSVKIATLAGPGTDAARRLLRSLPRLQRLALWVDEGRRCLEAALALEGLEHLDLRGQALSDDERALLEGWRTAAPGRSVRHERFDLRPVDLDDVFGARGLSWEPDPPPRTRVAAAPGEELTFACGRGRSVQLHLRDNPEWKRAAAAPVTALAFRAGGLIVGREDGVVEAWPDDGSEPVRIVGLPGAVRSLSAAGEAVAATFDGGWWVSRGERGRDERPALVLTASGMAWADGTCVRLEGPGEKAIELGEPVLALAAGGDAVAAVAGRHVWRLTPSGPELLGTRRSGRPVIALRGDHVAWTTTRFSAEIRRGEDRGSVTYPGGYSGGCDEPLFIADLAVAASGFIVAALEHGGANLLGPDGAMKADAFPGEPHLRWIFIYGGSILIAD